MKVTVQRRQTLSDIAIQVYGNAAAVAALAEANRISITDELEAGTELECPDIVYDRYMQDYVRKAKLMPATSTDNE